MSSERRRRRTLLVVTFLIFLLPIVGAWMLNIFAPDWRPFGTTNHGDLVQPVRAISAQGLQRMDGAAMDPGYFSGLWTLVHVADADCGQTCVDTLTRSYQVKQALGEDIGRVQLLVVLNTSAAAPPAKPAGRIPPAVTRAAATQEWLSHFSIDGPSAGPGPGIYLVDPQGYLMMRYAGDVDQRGLLADLERLLKISKIG
jgi:hypothetical protein